jgi:hypothetical protein
VQLSDEIGRQAARDPKLSDQLDASDAGRLVHRPQDLSGPRAGKDLQLITDEFTLAASLFWVVRKHSCRGSPPPTSAAARSHDSGQAGAVGSTSTTRPTGQMHASHELNVSVVSPEEAEFGTAEFWAGDRLFGFTRLEDGELVLRIEPQSDGGAVVVSAHSLAEALARAKQLLESQ